MSTTGCSASEHIEPLEGVHILPKPFEVESLGEGVDALNPEENVSLDLVASAVGYMTRVMSGEPTESVFGFPLFVARRIGGDAFAVEAQHLIDGINGLDGTSECNQAESTTGNPTLCRVAAHQLRQPCDEPTCPW